MKSVIKFSFLGISLISFQVLVTKDIKVIIASENTHKVEAVKKAFQEKFSNDSVQFIKHKSYSGVPEQPISEMVAVKGAKNRMNSLSNVESADYVVSIENYIEKNSYNNSWCDKGLVLIKNLGNFKETISYTQPVFIPNQFIETMQKISVNDNEGYSITIGQVIQQAFSDRDIDSHDWHGEPEFGSVSRQQLLHDAIFKSLNSEEIEYLKNQITFYPDFPKPGIFFADFWPIFSNPKSLKICIDLLFERYKTKDIDIVVGLESRGFILGSALASKLGVGFVPVRKPGKLPGAIHSVSYQKEYGFDTLTISQNAFKSNQRVLIIDDLIATGGSARAAINLVKLAGGMSVEFVTLLQIKELAEYTKLGVPFFNLID